MKLTYEKCGDYLIPNLIPDPEPEGELRKFGLMRRSYLENHRGHLFRIVVVRQIKGTSTYDTGASRNEI
ncbi:hypothetical protein C824_002264 [Schaedlerella arabinosiphila]|nr:hypothetical protein C824_002264 [Schaedlerella arabinosiphila]